jgi:hypothetical protein
MVMANKQQSPGPTVIRLVEIRTRFGSMHGIMLSYTFDIVDANLAGPLESIRKPFPPENRSFGVRNSPKIPHHVVS